jgi:hypothetical protein
MIIRGTLTTPDDARPDNSLPGAPPHVDNSLPPYVDNSLPRPPVVVMPPIYVIPPGSIGPGARLDAERAAQRSRQAYAIHQKQKKRLVKARASCELCRGTGWAPGKPGSVTRCPCTRAIHAIR